LSATWRQRHVGIPLKLLSLTARRRTLDGVLASPRANAVQQLVRIEHEAAYAGRVAGRIKPWQGHTDAADRCPVCLLCSLCMCHLSWL
jgi:hypothetical protein